MAENEWELVSPEGAVQIEKGRVNRHPEDLMGKTVLLHWNGKHNGDIFLNRVGELILEGSRDTRIIKGWEAVPATKQISQNPAASKLIAQKLSSLMPDIVIGAPGD